MRALSARLRGVSFEMLPPASIKLNPNNAREHNRKQLARLARSIERFGFITQSLSMKPGNFYAATHAF